MEFKEKQYDGNYEVSEVEFYNENQLFNGLLYFPPDHYQKPYSLIIYFHGFPQLSSLGDIVKNYYFLLDMGYSFLVMSFRGYNFTPGKISISSQTSDALKVLEFTHLMVKKGIFKKNNINILAHDFGAYIALILASRVKFLNKMLLLSPIINLEKHVNHIDFSKSLYYINRFLPGYVKGIQDVDNFIEMTKNELKQKKYQIKEIIKGVNVDKIRIISGSDDRITPIYEINEYIRNPLKNVEHVIISRMAHEPYKEEEFNEIEEMIKNFF
ncbi:MAG: alpha/beta hydrolase [Candidatus Lokiarchaeota archaeon]|nr:alpha/beta hydrolase [Candidatus Lokiarchaeota archaeon]